MRPAWRRVAERADNRAFASEEIGDSLARAVEQDCRDELRPGFLAELRRVMEEPSLFKDAVVGRLEALQPDAGPGFERAVLDRLSFLSAAEADSFATLQTAVNAAARDCANRRARQVEEHYLRESSSPRAGHVRGRLEAAIDGADFDALAARVLGADPKKLPAAPAKQTGLDDGVKLR